MQGAISSAEHDRLRAESQRIRAEAIRVRIASVHAFCSVLETEARWESAEKAQDGMGKVWHAIAELKRHLAEPEHIPATSVGELLRSLARLEDRAIRIHRALALPGGGFRLHGTADAGC
jgi:hypothetical protein